MVRGEHDSGSGGLGLWGYKGGHAARLRAGHVAGTLQERRWYIEERKVVRVIKREKEKERAKREGEGRGERLEGSGSGRSGITSGGGGSTSGLGQGVP